MAWHSWRRLLHLMPTESHHHWKERSDLNRWATSGWRLVVFVAAFIVLLVNLMTFGNQAVNVGVLCSAAILVAVYWFRVRGARGGAG